MKVYGLTGPSGSGKGTAAAIFFRFGIPSVDTDRVYHDLLLDPFHPCTKELAQTFGKDILRDDGTVDRKKLGALVFGHPETASLLHTLDIITHKYIMAKTRELLCDFDQQGAVAALIDAPQLFEAGADRECDLVIGVIANRDIRLQRIMLRDRIGEQEALRRINAQPDETFYRDRCDVIFENNEGEEALSRQIRGFLQATAQ